MGYRWREDPITGERILMNDAEAQRNSEAGVLGGMAVFTVVFGQMALPSGTSTLIRCVVGALSLGIGVVLGVHVLGIMAAIAAYLVALFFFDGGGDGLGGLLPFCVFGAVVNVAFFKWRAQPKVAPPSPPVVETVDRPQGFRVFNDRANDIARLHGSSESATEKAIRRHNKRNG